MSNSASAPPPVSTTPNSDKLSGQLIIKAQLGDDIRKIMIHNEDLTLNELVLMMERVFAGKISNSDEITIKYLDDDGDKITLLNDSDLTVALHFHKVLRLSVLVNGTEQPANPSTENVNKEGSLIDAKTFRTELQQIRNSVQNILDRLQLPTDQNTKTNQEKEAAPSTATASAFISGATREFDPYKHLQQTQRSSTPDSIRSRSSLSRKTVNNEQKSFPTTPTVPSVDNQFQQQASDSADANKASPNVFQPTQMPTPQFVPTGFTDQQAKSVSSLFGPPPTTSYPNIQPPPNAGAPRFPTAFAPPTFQNANAQAPPPAATAPPTSSFIGQQQQQQQQSPLGPPPQQIGFYAQQQAYMQQRPGNPTFNPNANNAYGQPPQGPPQGPPPSSSSPATINPSFVQPTGMPAPPPSASQQPYGNFPPQNNFFNPVQQYPKTS